MFFSSGKVICFSNILCVCGTDLEKKVLLYYKQMTLYVIDQVKILPEKSGKFDLLLFNSRAEFS